MLQNCITRMKSLYIGENIITHHVVIDSQVLNAYCMQTIVLQCTISSKICLELELFEAHWDPHTRILSRFFFTMYK